MASRSVKCRMRMCCKPRRFAAIQALVPEFPKSYKSFLSGPRKTEGPQKRAFWRRVSEGTRTPDRLDHNQELYQLSYAHQVRSAV
jgi:hypothetical protein